MGALRLFTGAELRGCVTIAHWSNAYLRRKAYVFLFATQLHDTGFCLAG